MRLVIAALLLWLTGGPVALAGAWMREEGRGFIAAGTVLRSDPAVAGTGRPVAPETRLYADYGLRPRLTLGIDINERPDIAGHALVFARLPLGGPGRRTRFALELGLGGHHVAGEWAGFYKAGLGLGRDFETRWGKGWMGADAAIEMRDGLAEPVYKLDAAAGLSSGQRLRPLLKLEGYRMGAASGWAVTPAVLIETGRLGTWVIGAERKSAGNRTVGLLLELWRWF